MSAQPVPLVLINANIALFKGERAEALRLLQQYENERPATEDPHRSMVLWLQAQAQPTDPDRIALLYQLIEKVHVDDPYSQMARDYLAAEEHYQPPAPRQVNRWTWAGLVVGGVLVLMVGGSFLLGLGSQTPTVTPTAVAISPTATISLPDESVPLVADAFTLRYESGIFQITAIEARSSRVTGADGALLQPVTGARFLALAVSFECRRGICNTPPEASVQLVTDNDDSIPVRAGAFIAGEPGFSPVALGRATRGWLVFEVPSLSRAQTLLVKPTAAPDDAPPLEIDLSVID